MEEPNAHIFLKPDFIEKKDVTTTMPKINEEKCNYCGDCGEICTYKALAVIKNKILFFSELCHGCLGCYFVCKQEAVEKEKKLIGIIEKGHFKNIYGQNSIFLHGKLNVGEPMAVSIISSTKNLIIDNKDVIIDAPPGTSCPVIESVKGSDFCLLVTEPTPFGLHDLKLMVEVVKKLNKPSGLVVNRSDMGNKEVWKYCKLEDIPILMEIPMDKKIAIAYSKGIPIVHEIPEYIPKFQKLLNKIKELIRN